MDSHDPHDCPHAAGVSRRGFLTSVSTGAIGVVSAAHLAGAVAQQAPPDVTAADAQRTIALTVNGGRQRPARRAPLVAALRPAREARPDRRRSRLRARRVRRLHGADRRRGALRLHDARGRGRRPRDHHARRPDERRGAGSRPAGVRRGGRVPVRLLHARADHGGRGPPARQRRRRPSTRSASACPATSADAAPTPHIFKAATTRRQLKGHG